MFNESQLAERILQTAPEGILYIDAAGRIVFANPAAVRLLGYDAADDVVGQPIRTHIPVDQELCYRADGSSFPVDYSTTPMSSDEGSVGTLISFVDISRRRAAERHKDELISVVSHELRTPLTSIRSSLGLIASGRLGQLVDTGQRMVDIAVNNTDRLIRLINDILDLERIDSGTLLMRTVICDATKLMSQASDGLRAIAEESNIIIEVLPSEGRVPGDPDRLLQVLINLLSNAIKFSPPTGGRIWLDAEQAPGELVFRVRDQGRGIPADKLEAVFDRFAQVDDPDSHEKGGSGLGLAICREIVKQHGGQIWAESSLGAGTTLCVALPREEVELSRLVPSHDQEGGHTIAAAA